MTDLNIEYCSPHTLFDTHEEGLVEVPVVRLEAVDQVIGEAVWAMELVRLNTASHMAEHHRAIGFLASPLVAEWRKRQEAQP